MMKAAYGLVVVAALLCIGVGLLVAAVLTAVIVLVNVGVVV